MSRNRFSFRFVYQKFIWTFLARPGLAGQRDVLAFNLSITLKMPGDAQPLLRLTPPPPAPPAPRRQATHFRYVNDLSPLTAFAAFNCVLSDPLSEDRRIWTRRISLELCAGVAELSFLISLLNAGSICCFVSNLIAFPFSMRALCVFDYNFCIFVLIVSS